jgi:hypothetical protein
LITNIGLRTKLRRNIMSIMEEVYDQLKQDNFVDTAEDFSVDWCWRSKSWYSVQKNKGSDFSIAVAINCLNKVKIKIALEYIKKKKFGSIAESNIRLLNAVQDKLSEYLLLEHRIAGIDSDDFRL